MRKLITYQTSDGKSFEDIKLAKRHAEERFGNALCALAREAVKVEKYANMVSWLELNLAKMNELTALAFDRDQLCDETAD